MKLIALLFIILLFPSQSSVFQKHYLDRDSGARCLDGTVPTIYIHEGDKKDKILIYFEGGGLCHDMQSCFKRSLTFLGSSSYNHQSMKPKQGICSPDIEKNPVFWNWVKVFVNYCDGSLYFGDVEKPKQHLDKKLYFRGSRNALEVFRYLDKKYDLYNQKTVVLSGVSAGAVGTYYWVDYLKQHAKTSKVYAIPDSGIFLPTLKNLQGCTPLETDITKLLQILGEPKGENVPPPVAKCLKANGKESQVACVGSYEFVKYIESPMFIVQSLYDAFSIQYIVGTDCACNQNKIQCLHDLISELPESLQNCKNEPLNETQAIEQFSTKMRKTIDQIIEMKKMNIGIGVWAPACAQHGFLFSHSYNSDKYKVPQKTGYKLYEGIQKFLQNPKSAPISIDKDSWPSNRGCSHLIVKGSEGQASHEEL